MGISVPVQDLDNFIAAASEAAGAIRKIDFSKLTEDIREVQKVSKSIKSGELGRNVDSSTYESLIKAMPELANSFQETLNGEFVYLGGSMEELQKAIEENTQVLLQSAIQQLQTKVDAAELMGDFAKNRTWDNGEAADINKWQEWDTDGSDQTSVANYLSTFISEASKYMNLEDLGIKGLSNDTEVEKLSIEKQEEMISELAKVYNSKDSNLAEMNSKLISSLSMTYQNQDATSNAMIAKNYRDELGKGKRLNTDDMAAWKASQRTLIVQAREAGVNEKTISEYSSRTTEMEGIQDKLAAGGLSANEEKELKRRFKILSAEAQKFEAEMTNKTNLKNMNNNLSESFGAIDELREKFKQAKDDATQMEIVAEMAGKFGITVTAQNKDEIQRLMEDMIAGGEEGYAAFSALMNKSAESFGVDSQELSQLVNEAWNDSTKQMPEDMQAFADAMVASGAGMWKTLSDGSKQFVFATEDNLSTAAETAGTIFEAWENPYDWLYNYNQEINRVIKEREKAEREYSRLLEDESSSAADLLASSKAQLSAIQKEVEMRKAGADMAKQDIQDKFAETDEKYTQYVRYDFETNGLVVDYINFLYQ